MKSIISLLFILSSAIVFSQSDSLFGEYYQKLEGENHLIEYELYLNENGTYTFHYYSKILQVIPPIVHKYGKGKWTDNGKIVSFFSDKEKDFDEKYTLDLNNSRARFIQKSPRDKTERIIKTRLQFFESENFLIERIAVFKK